MKDYYCLELKFKDKTISCSTFHAHLFVNDKEMYFQIIDNESGSQLDMVYMKSKSAHGLFENNFEITWTEVDLFFNNSKIYRTQSFQNNDQNTYFTIYVNNIAVVFENKHKEFVNEGKAYLNNNGLKIVNSFYSFFTNFRDKNIFSISRMNGMDDFYDANQISFRPELEFTNNEKRDSEGFTVKKIPTINYKFENLDFEKAKHSMDIVCSFLSFCYGIKIIIEKLTYRTEDQIFIYRDTSPNNKTFVSDFSTVFYQLEENCRIEKILKTGWYANYLTKEKKFEKAIDNYLHSREVDLSASFLLLFNIIEIFNSSQEIEKFKFNKTKEANFLKAYELILSSLDQNEDAVLLKDKWGGIISKLEIKPLKSPLEETLKLNNINPLDFGYSFSKLKQTRDKLTHGSVDKISDQILKSQILSLRKITTRLILGNLGLKNDFKILKNND